MGTGLRGRTGAYSACSRETFQNHLTPNGRLEAKRQNGVTLTEIPQLHTCANGERRLMVDGRPFTLLAGECHNSASGGRRAFADALDRAQWLGMNTVLAPVTWELLEPAEGKYDFWQLDMMLELARERGLHLGVLWFGAYKNAQCYYAPAWVKRDVRRFRRAQMVPGQNKIIYEEFYGFAITALSLFCPETLEADALAYAALMAHLRDVDGAEHTVVTVQVENECGQMVAAREHDAWADAAFAQEVPPALVEALRADPSAMAPEVLAALEAGVGAGTWEQVFGEHAEELFTTYHMARYVEQVAAAGRAEYALPTACNCWLDKGHKPGRFPTGGPNLRVLGVWKHAAPSIDMVGPDIYVPTFCQVCEGYTRPDNLLFIPETATHAYAAAREIWAVGHLHAFCFSPFGYEEMGEPFGDSAGILFGMDTSDPALRTPQDPGEYAAVTRGLARLLEMAADDAAYATLDAVSSEVSAKGELCMGDVVIKVSFAEGALPGACAALVGADGAVYLLALRCALALESRVAGEPHVGVDALETGTVENGTWQRDCRLNGDEVGIMRCDEPTLLRLTTITYA